MSTPEEARQAYWDGKNAEDWASNPHPPGLLRVLWQSGYSKRYDKMLGEETLSNEPHKTPNETITKENNK